MKKLHEDAKLLEAMGGAKEVANKLNLNVTTVYGWMNRGLPARFQLDNPAFMRKAKKLASK